MIGKSFQVENVITSYLCWKYIICELFKFEYTRVSLNENLLQQDPDIYKGCSVLIIPSVYKLLVTL